jgi:hypothetical protein
MHPHPPILSAQLGVTVYALLVLEQALVPPDAPLSLLVPELAPVLVVGLLRT